MILEQLREVERRNDSDRLSIGKLFIGTFTDPFEQRHGVIDKDVNVSAFCDDLGGEPFKHGFIGEVTHKPRPLLDVNHMNVSALTLEAFGTEHKQQIIKALSDNGYEVKLVQTTI